jgi:hypothetical protein
MVLKVWVDGEQVSPRVLALSRDAAKAAKVNMPRVLQGYWSKAGVSAGTHTGGGAFDFAVFGMTHAQQEPEPRRRNGARGCVTQPGWTDGRSSTASCVTSLTSPGCLAAGAELRRRKNGLANGAHHPRPSRSLTTPSSGPL